MGVWTWPGVCSRVRSLLEVKLVKSKETKTG
jgi:hypothetical protein